MKRFLLFIIVCFLSLTVNAQLTGRVGKVNGTFTLPDSEKYVLLKFDFSETVFENKYNEEDWMLLHGEEEWAKAKNYALEKIVKWMNEKMEKTRIIMVIESMPLAAKTNYTLYIKPLEYEFRGTNKSEFVLKYNENGEVLGTVKTSENGGHFGELDDLLGDGYERNTPEIAKLIAKYNRN